MPTAPVVLQLKMLLFQVKVDRQVELHTDSFTMVPAGADVSQPIMEIDLEN